MKKILTLALSMVALCALTGCDFVTEEPNGQQTFTFNDDGNGNGYSNGNSNGSTDANGNESTDANGNGSTDANGDSTLSAFPQTEVQQFNSNIAILEPAGASHFTLEDIIQEDIDWDNIDEDRLFDEDYEWPIIEVLVGKLVTAYGVDSTEMTAYLNSYASPWRVNLLGVNEEQTAGSYVAQRFGDNNEYYEIFLEYDMTKEELAFYIGPKTNTKYSNSFPTAAVTQFLTANSISETVPSFETTGIDCYMYEYDKDCLYVYVYGDYTEQWLGFLNQANWNVPTEAVEDYGYECTNVESTLEIDVFYDADYYQTSICIYTQEYLDSIGF